MVGCPPPPAVPRGLLRSNMAHCPELAARRDLLAAELERTLPNPSAPRQSLLPDDATAASTPQNEITSLDRQITAKAWAHKVSTTSCVGELWSFLAKAEY